MSLARSIALNVIKSFVPLNIPGSEIIGYLKTLGVSYRRTDMLTDIRVAYGRVKYETNISNLRSDQTVPVAWMSREEINAPYNYRVTLKVNYYDPVNDVYTTEQRSMFADEYKSVGNYVNDFPDYALSKDYVQEKEFQGASVVGVTINTKGGAAF